MSETLDLLEQIVKGAESASGKTTGQPLRAAEWNTLAGAIVRLAQLAATRERNEADTLAKDFARADHQHIGEVGLTWFDAPTRALVEGKGAGADTAARLDGLARDTKALRDQMTALTTQVERLRDSLTNATTEDLVRDANIRRFGDRLDGLADVDRRITGLDTRLTGIGGDVRAALEFRDTLRDEAGNPLDLAGLAGRVDGLARNQERLRLADGEVVRIRDFENRIANLESGGVTEDQLDTRIGTRLDLLLQRPDNILVQRAGEVAAASLNPRFDGLDRNLTDTRGEIATIRDAATAADGRIRALDARVTTAAQQGDRTAATVGTLSGLPDRTTAVEASANAATVRLGTVDTLATDLAAMRRDVTAATALTPRVTALETTVTEGTRRLGIAETAVATLPDLRGRIAAAEASATRADALGTRITTLEGNITTTGDRLTVAESRLAAVDTLSNRVSVVERSATDLSTWRRDVDTRLNNLPTRTAVDDLTARLGTVERTTAEQNNRIITVERSNDAQVTRLGTVERTVADQNTRIGNLGRTGVIVRPVG